MPAAAGLTFLFLSFILKKSGDNKTSAQAKLLKLKDELNSLIQEKNALSEEKNDLMQKISAISSEIDANKVLNDRRNADINAKKEMFISENEARNKARDELIAYFGRYKDVSSVEEITDEMNKFSDILETQKELKTKLTVISKDLNNISYEEAEEKIKKIESGTLVSNEDLEEQKKNLAFLQEKITETKEKISALSTELKAGFHDFISPETIKRNIIEQSEKIKSKEDFCKAADIAAEVLNESAVTMRKTYGSTLENDTMSNFSALTMGKYGAVSLGKGMTLKAEESDSFGMHDVDYLSRGTKNGAYLALRLAISSLLSKDNPLPVLLDDSLSQFDDKRLLNALQFLSEYSKTNQTVLFTCHEQVCRLSEPLGANIKNM